MKPCRNLAELCRYSAGRLRQAFREHRHYETEREGRDIGAAEAERRFMDSEHFPAGSVRWRVEFCGSLCRLREGCELGKALVRRDLGEEKS